MSHLFNRLVSKPKFWDYKKGSFWSTILLPFSAIYLLLSFLIKISKKRKKFSIPIICVGNIYIGGTGKTPLVREIYKITKSFGKNPAFIKKNYEYVKDEINILKKTGKTYYEKNRSQSINLSISHKHDTIILDDGFQDFSVKKDFSILCFNSKQQVGNGFIIPSGPMREPLSSILRSNCIMINGEKNLEFEHKINKITKDKKIPIFYSKYKIRNIKKIENIEVIAFAGIGNPNNFFDLLRDNNIKIKKTYSFPDHYEYTDEDFIKIIGDKSTKIVTTEKDYYRIKDHQKFNFECINVDLKIEKEDEFKKLIKESL